MTQPPPCHRQRGAAPLAIVIVLAGVILSLVVTLQALSAYRSTSVRRDWDETLGSQDEILQRFPATEVNASALELERIASRLGVDIVPRQSGRADALRKKQTVAFESELQAAFYGYLKTQVENARRGELDAPPPEVLAYIDTYTNELIALRQHLNRAELAVWESDLSLAIEAPLPNLLGHIKLQKLLTSVALARLHGGDDAGALADLEAARQLSGSLRDSPFLISQLILIAGTRMQLGVLRHIPDLDEVWLERLAEFDFRESFITTMKLEGLFWLDRSSAAYWQDGLPAWQRVASPVMQPYSELCLADLSDAWRERLLNLEQVDALCDRDLAPYDADLDIPIPRWNLVGKYVVPNLLGAIGRLARLELDIELTRLLIETDAIRRENDGAWPESYATKRDSSTCPDDRWNFNIDGEQLEIALSRDIQWPGQKGPVLPTRATR